MGQFPSILNNYKLRPSLHAGKAIKWARSISDMLQNEYVPHGELGKLIGTLGFVRIQAFSGFA